MKYSAVIEWIKDKIFLRFPSTPRIVIVENITKLTMTELRKDQYGNEYILLSENKVDFSTFDGEIKDKTQHEHHGTTYTMQHLEGFHEGRLATGLHGLFGDYTCRPACRRKNDSLPVRKIRQSRLQQPYVRMGSGKGRRRSTWSCRRTDQC